ncbi:MAG: aminoglycoside phosphotransferase, partial [Clostridia bacterium]|nr:aminoglycoside phosphotransferase [Clostridia bacterium]
MENDLESILRLYGAKTCTFRKIPEHDGGRNTIFVIENSEGEKRVLRISTLEDRTEDDYLAETEFIH